MNTADRDLLETVGRPWANASQPTTRTDGGRGGTIRADQRPVSLLTTTGRRSGRPRKWPVIDLRRGDQTVVVASNAGRDHHPAWCLNLRVHPDCVLQTGDEGRAGTARDATEAEAEQLWPELDALYSGYAEYAAKTERRLPVVILEPKQPVT